MNICIYGASSASLDEAYIKAVEILGKTIAQRGHAMIFGGGQTGLMGAAAKGMSLCGGKITGVAPRFFDKPGVLYENCNEMIFTETMRERKQLMEDLSDAFIAVPGGIGTLEEFFEILTLKQLSQHHKPIGLFNANGYYTPLLAMLERALAEGFMDKRSMDLFTVSENPVELLKFLESNI